MARASTFCVAGTGPRPIRCGATPALALATTRARGVRPCRSTASSLATTIAAAPSDSGEDDPAVTMPRARKTVRSVASFSSDVDARGPSSTRRVADRHDLGREPARLGGRHRALVAAQRERVGLLRG